MLTMQWSSLPRVIFSLALLAIAGRLFWLIFQETSNRSEVAIYYVSFFWVLAGLMKEPFRRGVLSKSVLSIRVTATIYALIAFVGFIIGRGSALDTARYDGNASFFAFFSTAYVVLFLAALFGTGFLRRKGRRHRSVV